MENLIMTNKQVAELKQQIQENTKLFGLIV